jgi:VanZ family protein
VEKTRGRTGLPERILAWGLVVLWMALIFLLSSSSDPPVPRLGDQTLDFILRKLGHAAGYAVLASLLYRALRPHPHALWLAFLVASLYAAGDEWHQTFVPERDGNIRDWAIDSAGAVAGLAGIVRLTRGGSSSRLTFWRGR